MKRESKFHYPCLLPGFPESPLSFLCVSGVECSLLLASCSPLLPAGNLKA